MKLAVDIEDTIAFEEIKVLLPADQIEWMKTRGSHFDSWYKVGFSPGVKEKLQKPVDKDGPVLDFLIVGFPKCGTTSLMANLASLSQMPTRNDVCVPPSRTVLYAYKHWPQQYGNHQQNANNAALSTTNFDKIFTGSKCPMFISGGWIYDIKEYLPRTKLIVGIRHPIKWFESFWRMYGAADPYEKVHMCPCNVDEYGRRVDEYGKRGKCNFCRDECPKRQRFCLARARFHLPLARLGKTPLGSDERQLLAPNDLDGGENLIPKNVSNPIFLYEQTQLTEDYVWEELADFLGVSYIPNHSYEGSKGLRRNYTLCDPVYDAFRAMMMPYAFDLSLWLQQYFLPVAKDVERPDVRVADVDRFSEIVKTYAEDPCQRLIRLYNGTYVLHPSFGVMIPVPPSDDASQKK